MKKLIVLFAAAAILLPSLSYSAQLDRSIEKSFEKLADAYNKQYPAAGMKKGLAVLPVKEETVNAKSKALGTTVRELVSKQVLNSRIFYLIDRDTLEQSLKEAELSMTGLVDDASITSAGKLIGVEVFITGSITEVNGNYSITLRMIDSETGKVVAMETATVPVEKMYAIKRPWTTRQLNSTPLA